MFARRGSGGGGVYSIVGMEVRVRNLDPRMFSASCCSGRQCSEQEQVGRIGAVRCFVLICPEDIAGEELPAIVSSRLFPKTLRRH